MYTGYDNCTANFDREKENVQFLYITFTKIDTFITNFIISHRRARNSTDSSLGLAQFSQVSHSVPACSHTHICYCANTVCMIVSSPARVKQQTVITKCLVTYIPPKRQTGTLEHVRQ